MAQQDEAKITWRKKQMETFKSEDYTKMDDELRQMIGEPTEEGISEIQKILKAEKQTELKKKGKLLGKK